MRRSLKDSFARIRYVSKEVYCIFVFVATNSGLVRKNDAVCFTFLESNFISIKKRKGYLLKFNVDRRSKV